jgi:hypothetical protein
MPLGAAGASAVDSSVRAAPRADGAVSSVTAAPARGPPADSSMRRRAAAEGAAAMPAPAPPAAAASLGVGVESGPVLFVTEVGAVWAAFTTVGALVAAAGGGVGGGVLAVWGAAAVCALTKAACGCAAACAGVDALT